MLETTTYQVALLTARSLTKIITVLIQISKNILYATTNTWVTGMR